MGSRGPLCAGLCGPGEGAVSLPVPSASVSVPQAVLQPQPRVLRSSLWCLVHE